MASADLVQFVSGAGRRRDCATIGLDYVRTLDVLWRLGLAAVLVHQAAAGGVSGWPCCGGSHLCEARRPMTAHQPRPSRYASSTSQCGRGHALDQGFSWLVCQLYLVVADPTGGHWSAQGWAMRGRRASGLRRDYFGEAACDGALRASPSGPKRRRLCVAALRGGVACDAGDECLSACRLARLCSEGVPLGRALWHGPKQSAARGGGARRHGV